MAPPAKPQMIFRPPPTKLSRRFEQIIQQGRAGSRRKAGSDGQPTSSAEQGLADAQTTPAVRATRAAKLNMPQLKESREEAQWFDVALINRIMFRARLPNEVQFLIFSYLIVKPAVHYVAVDELLNQVYMMPRASDRSMHRAWGAAVRSWPLMMGQFRATFAEPRVIFPRSDRWKKDDDHYVKMVDGEAIVIDNRTDLVAVSIQKAVWKPLLREILGVSGLRPDPSLRYRRAAIMWDHNETLHTCQTPDPEHHMCPHFVVSIMTRVANRPEKVYLMVKMRQKDLAKGRKLPEVIEEIRATATENKALEVFHDTATSWYEVQEGFHAAKFWNFYYSHYSNPWVTANAVQVMMEERIDAGPDPYDVCVKVLMAA